jgi:hypothetical protein
MLHHWGGGAGVKIILRVSCADDGVSGKIWAYCTKDGRIKVLDGRTIIGIRRPVKKKEAK